MQLDATGAEENAEMEILERRETRSKIINGEVELGGSNRSLADVGCFSALQNDPDEHLHNDNNPSIDHQQTCTILPLTYILFLVNHHSHIVPVPPLLLP
jgi:hypothetical protein